VWVAVFVAGMTDLAGKTILVTGASSGHWPGGGGGLRQARRRGGDGRAHRTRSEAALAGVEVALRLGKVSLLLHDLGTLAAVRALAAEFRAKHKRLDVLGEQRGGCERQTPGHPRRLRADLRREPPRALPATNLLLDLVKASAPSRIVVGRERRATGAGTMDFENLHFEKGGYSIMGAYGRSKLANILFANELSRRLAGTGVVVNSLHPGGVATNIWSKRRGSRGRFYRSPKRLFMITPEEGGATIVTSARARKTAATSGAYFEKNAPVKPSRLARDEALAKRLWEVSERLTGISP